MIIQLFSHYTLHQFIKMKYPFKFLDPYGQNDKDFFFGRDKDIQNLYEMTFKTNMVFIYGPSGSGKTSLIQCGLANCFSSTDWFDFYIRKGENISESILQTLRKAEASITITDDLDWGDEYEDIILEEDDTEAEEEQEEEVQQLLHDLYGKVLKPIYLIFDQFEELYTLGTKEEQKAFIADIKNLAKVDVPCTFIFVMREEYLFHLYEFEKEVPHLLQKKLRVESMNERLIDEVIKGSTTASTSCIHLKGDEVAQKEIGHIIFQKISEGKRLVQLSYLQLFLDSLYEKVAQQIPKGSQQVTFSMADVKAMPDIKVMLEQFLDQQIAVVNEKLKKLNVKKNYGNLPKDFVSQLLSSLVTYEATKKPMSEQELRQENKFKEWSNNDLIPQTLNFLESVRVLRYREEDEVYEIAHDTLALKIAYNRSVEEKALLKAEKIVKDNYFLSKDKQTQRYLDRTELNFIRQFESKIIHSLDKDQLAFLESSKKNRTRKNFLSRLSIVTIFASIIAAILYIQHLNQGNLITQLKLASENEKKQKIIEKELNAKVAIRDSMLRLSQVTSAQQTLISQQKNILNEKAYQEKLAAARSYTNQKSFQEAINIYNELLSENPSDSNAKSLLSINKTSKKFYNLTEKGDKYYNSGQYNKALIEYRKAEKIGLDEFAITNRIKSTKEKIDSQ